MPDKQSPASVPPHPQTEDDPWTIMVDGHLQRSDSQEFIEAKNVAHKILPKTLAPQFFTEDEMAGSGTQIQMHHGGSIYLHDDKGWFMCKNLAGIEWSSQFCADPAKVEVLRQTVERLVAAFPQTIPKLVELGYADAAAVVSTPITTPELMARWTDSIFNACVPLPQGRHTGALPTGDGVHHYPTPITDIDLIKRTDFPLWVTDPQSNTPVAVVPRDHRGSGAASVSVISAQPGTALHAAKQQAKAKGTDLLLPRDHPIAIAAFAAQTR